MDSLKLIARIAGQRVALAAQSIESVVEIEAVTPVPLAPPHVAGLAALRSRVLTVIDSYAAIGVGAIGADHDVLQVAVVAVDGHLYGLVVDEVDDVVSLRGECLPLPAGLANGWETAALGLVEHEDQAILLLDPVRLIAGPVATAA